MAAEQFSLCWDNFHSNMSTGLSSLLKSEDLVDVTLAAEGRYLKAHKMVLSVCSPYFRELFQVNPCQHPIVFLKDVSFSALNNLLEFMYQGEVKVSQDDLGTFIKTAEALKIKGLTGDGSSQSDVEVDVTPDENNTAPSDPPPPPTLRKSLREKSPPPVRKKMLGPASKRFKTDVDQQQYQEQQQQEPVATETVVPKQQHQTSLDQIMTFKLEPEESAVALLNEEEVHYDDSTMDDMTMDNTTDYLLETTATTASSKNMDVKGESSSAADTADAVGENQVVAAVAVYEKSEEEIFMDYYRDYYEKKPNKRPYNKNQLDEIAKEIGDAKTSAKKSRKDYYLLKTYDVVSVNGEVSVVRKVKHTGDPVICLVPEEDIYKRLHDIHINCGHGSRDKMLSIVRRDCSISRPCVQMFLKSCLYKFVVTQLGTLNLALHQHLYRPRNMITGTAKRLWVCTWRDKHCPAKCISYAGKLVSKKGMHNHPSQRDAIAMKERSGQVCFRKLF